MFPPPTKKPRLLPLPHPRADCPSHLFHPSVHDTSHARNLRCCTSCFCLVCDAPATECPAWSVHCMAYYTHPEWRSLRVRRILTVPAHLLPPCVMIDRKNAQYVDNVRLWTNPKTIRVHAPEICHFIDLENDHPHNPQLPLKKEPKQVQSVENANQRTSGCKSDSPPAAENQPRTQHPHALIKSTQHAKSDLSPQVHKAQRPTSVNPVVESHATHVPDKSVLKHCQDVESYPSQQPANPTAKIQAQHEIDASHQVRPVSSVKREQQVQPPHPVSTSKRSADRNAPSAPLIFVSKRDEAGMDKTRMVTPRVCGTTAKATAEIASSGLPAQRKRHSSAESIDSAREWRSDYSDERAKDEERSYSEERSDESELQGSDVQGSHDDMYDSESDLFGSRWYAYHGQYSRLANRNTCREELKDLRRFWNVDKMLPAPHIEKKRLQPTSATTGKFFSKRILIGYIDMWRPYCSHMAARSIQFSVGRHAKDVASISSATDVRVAGMKSAQVEVLATEMGIDLERTTLLSVESRFDDNDLKGLQPFIHKSSYAWEDGSSLSAEIPRALRECIAKNQIELKWELSHHAGAENNDKAFATEHGAFRKLDRESRREVYRQQLAWLTQCESRLKNVEKLNTSNCCLLRAWVYLAPQAFRSNMVTAASFCPTNSPQAHMQPLDGDISLGQKLSNNHNWKPRGRAKTPPPSLPPKDVEKSRRNWDDLELSAHESDRYGFCTIMAALRCHDSGFVASPSAAENGPRYSTVLDAATADGILTFQSLCRTYRAKLDSVTRNRTWELIDELRNVSNENEDDIGNKASIRGVLSSSTFTVSNGYASAADQPAQIALSLRGYQKESLAWMLDQESKRSISDPFWVKIRGFSGWEGQPLDVFYCPLTGSMSRFAPPPVVGGVLAEEMGLGKTIIAVSLIVRTLDEARRTYRIRSDCRTDLVPSHGTLIVCPVSLLKQWEKEIRSNVSIPLNVLCWYGPRTSCPENLAKYDVVLTTYGILSGGHHNPLTRIHWFRVIIDESTYLKGGGSSCHRQYMDLVGSRRWAVSGTPFGDDFKRKFLPTMRFIGVAPFSNISYFRDLADAFTTPLDDLPEPFVIPRFAYVMKSILMRHVKAQKLHGEPLVDLPPATGRCVSIELGTDEKAEYEKLEREVKQRASRFLRSQKTFGTHFVELASMARPLRVKADGVEPESLRKPRSRKGPAESNEKPEAPPPVKNASRRVGAKVKQLLSDVRSYRDKDASSKFVVFTEFNGVKEEIKRTIQGNGLRVLTLDGSMTAGRRGRLIKQFAEDPDVAVLVLSMAAGACGLTLTMANVVVLFEVGLKMAMELQAVNRIHRIGQTREVETLTYVANGTIDERIVEVRKRRGQPGVVGEKAEGKGENLTTLEVYRKMFAYEEA